MKKVIGMLAVLAFGSSIASAELLKNFKYDGKIEVNAAVTNNRADYNSDVNDKTSDVDTRVQFNMGFDLVKDVDAVVSLVKNNRNYGDGSEEVGCVQHDIYIEQAYMNLHNVLGFDHKVGRQYYGNEGDLVIYYGPTGFPFYNDTRIWGNTGDPMPVNALDAYTGWYTNGKWDIHGVAGKEWNNTGGYPDNDGDVTGAEVKYALSKNTNVGGYYYQRNEIVGETDWNLIVMGVKANGNIGDLVWSAELAKNGGSFGDSNNTGSALKANVAYGLNIGGRLNLTGEYYSGSPDDVAGENHGFMAINSDYRPGMLFGTSGLASWGWLSFADYNIGATWNPTKVKELTLGAKYFHFTPATSEEYYYGNEFDFSADWKHSENVSLKAYVSYFKYCADYIAGADAVSLMGTALTVKF